ncbi:TPA: branched-chain amino acid transport system II carrier protein [Staphylococcus aureus]|nr:branched-chain amino acid transport system II carrier protein [Staphylococcus aureus]
MFFGAGNLIFPPNLGLDSGQFFWPAIPTKRITQQIPVIIVFILSIFSVISKLGWLKINFIESLPLRAYSLEWFPVAIIATILGYLVGIFVKQDPIKYQQE